MPNKIKLYHVELSNVESSDSVGVYSKIGLQYI